MKKLAVILAIVLVTAVSSYAQVYDLALGLTFPTNRFVALHSAPSLQVKVHTPTIGRHMSFAGAVSTSIHNPVNKTGRSIVMVNPQIGVNGEWNLPVVGDHRIGTFLSIGYMYVQYTNLPKSRSWSVSWNALSYIAFENSFLTQIGLTFSEPYLPLTTSMQVRFVMFTAGIGLRL